MIRLNGVSRSFPRPVLPPVRAVRSLDLHVSSGETVCLIGPSGCGKTTTLRLINRLEEADGGQVLVDGVDVRSQNVIRLRRRIGYVVQNGGLFPHLSVRQNVGLLCRLEGWPGQDVRRRADELLDRVHLPPREFGDRFPAELSGGQHQRVGVARSLALDPPIVLMDEPFGALDPITRARLHDEFLELAGAVRKTIVMVSHDLDEAFKLADRVALMHDGAIVQIGDLAAFRDAPASDYVTQFMERHLHAH
jgi:osmoprotectant transport system ATP-binding protein